MTFRITVNLQSQQIDGALKRRCLREAQAMIARNLDFQRHRSSLTQPSHYFNFKIIVAELKKYTSTVT